MSESQAKPALDSINHIAVSVSDISEAVSWYTQRFRCTVEYQDETWAFLRFSNIQLALVIPQQHPPHIAFVTQQAESFGKLVTHRDGSRSCYIEDPAGNSVEIVEPLSVNK